MKHIDIQVGRVYRGRTGGPRRVVDESASYRPERRARHARGIGYSRPDCHYVRWMTGAVFARWAVYEIPAAPTDKDPTNG